MSPTELSSPRKRPTVAIVGAGLMGRWHAYYARRAGASVRAVCDLQHERAAALAGRFSGARAVDIDEAIDSADIVQVCLPPEIAFEIAGRVLRSGRHLLIEKPLAFDQQAARELYRLAGENNVLLTPVHQFPFQHGFRRLKATMGDLGAPVRADMMICSAGGDGLSADARRRLLLGILPHPLSVFRALFGVGALQADWKVTRFDADRLEMASEADGVSLRIDLDLRGRPACNRLSLRADGGSAYADFFHGFSWRETGTPSRRDKLLRPFAHAVVSASAAAGNLARRALHRQPAYPGLPELIQAFYSAWATAGPPPIPDDDVIAITRLMESTAKRA